MRRVGSAVSTEIARSYVQREWGGRLPRCLGLDLGLRRTGMALGGGALVRADPVPLESVAVKAPRGRRKWSGESSVFEAVYYAHAFERIRHVCDRESIQLLVVGYPLLPDGTPGSSCLHVERFVEKLILSGLRCNHMFWDERYSTRASRLNIGAYGDESVDGLAAVQILRSFLTACSDTNQDPFAFQVEARLGNLSFEADEILYIENEERFEAHKARGMRKEERKRAFRSGSRRWISCSVQKSAAQVRSKSNRNLYATPGRLSRELSLHSMIQGWLPSVGHAPSSVVPNRHVSRYNLILRNCTLKSSYYL